jgi:hypothetical protein
VDLVSQETPTDQQHHHHSNTTIAATLSSQQHHHQQHHHTIHPAHELSNRAGFTTTSTTTRTKQAKTRPIGYLVQLGTRSSS